MSQQNPERRRSGMDRRNRNRDGHVCRNAGIGDGCRERFIFLPQQQLRPNWLQDWKGLTPWRLTCINGCTWLTRKLGLPEGFNERVSEEVSQLIACSFE